MPEEITKSQQAEPGVGERTLPVEVPKEARATPDASEVAPQVPVKEAMPEATAVAPQEEAIGGAAGVPESAEPEAEASAAATTAPPQPEVPLEELLRQPSRIRTFSPEQQLKVICDMVVAHDFPAAHNFIEALGKSDDLAFYAWLEDALHDTALRDDWREYLKSKK
ncbi:MAG: hypothetical protein Q8R13_05590 [bacterium]|nr:hypothetical protein [bacterium]MDZ4296467.1 hypothetical protein [Patescibacteria group bacterium]